MECEKVAKNRLLCVLQWAVRELELVDSAHPELREDKEIAGALLRLRGDCERKQER